MQNVETKITGTILTITVEKDVEAMNGTAKAYTDGQRWWTLTNPQPQQGAMP